MKIVSLIFFLLSICFIIPASAQKYAHANSIYMSEFTGRWQRNYKIVGNGLEQNFQFFKDSSFILHLEDDGDDARRVISLKGKYRVKKGIIFFTITSETEIVGGNVIVDPNGYGLAFNIFDIDSGEIKEIPVKNPVEQAPCYITIINKSCIKLDNETYYKISNNPNMFNE